VPRSAADAPDSIRQDEILLSRIKEAHDGGLPNDRAVAIGLERTGRIVTAAALLFAVAIGAFVTSKLVFIKELGLGTALAVLIDASLVRGPLVPSLMGLLGKWELVGAAVPPATAGTRLGRPSGPGNDGLSPIEASERLAIEFRR
jgi:uncharacterized membrane protein YdfJ with MMPL/SSD domain